MAVCWECREVLDTILCRVGRRRVGGTVVDAGEEEEADDRVLGISKGAALAIGESRLYSMARGVSRMCVMLMGMG